MQNFSRKLVWVVVAALVMNYHLSITNSKMLAKSKISYLVKGNGPELNIADGSEARNNAIVDQVGNFLFCFKSSY